MRFFGCAFTLYLCYALIYSLINTNFNSSNNPTGLRYEDLLIEEHKEVEEALKLADPEYLTGRTRRLKRAIDLSYKKKSLQDYAPDMELDIFKEEIYPIIEKIRARDQEFAQLNAHNKA